MILLSPLPPTRALGARRSTKRRTLSALAEGSAEASRFSLLPLLSGPAALCQRVDLCPDARALSLWRDGISPPFVSRRVIARYSG